MSLSNKLNWVAAVVGLWFIISPFLLGYSSLPKLFWNSVVVGALIIVLSVVSALSSDRTLVRIMNWSVIALASWLYISALFLGQGLFYPIYLWNALITGLVVFYLEIFSIISIQAAAPGRHA
jgi:hypothetical protein